MIEELTAENRPYAVELQCSQAFESAYREGHQWFVDDGILVAESAQVVAIQIPARRI